MVPGPALLFVEDLGLERGELRLDLSLEVEAGRTVAIVGPSGAGKTSLLQAVAGLIKPRRGSIESNGTTWFDAAKGISLAPERRTCAYVFQDYALFPHLSAWRNVAYPLRRLSRGERRRRAHELLDRFGLAARAGARPSELSGGERQRVALARALALSPAALLLDEPLAALDAQTRAAATRELGRVIAEAGVPAIVVTHDFGEAATFGEELCVLDGGRIVQRGTPSAVAMTPGSPFVAELVGQSVLRGRARSASDGGTEIELEGGGRVISTDSGASGPVAIGVHPWEVLIEPPGRGAAGSARNRLPARVASLTDLGGRVRVGLDVGQTIVAEVTPGSVETLGLTPGAEVQAVWKASATRIVERYRRRSDES